jgi:hypothetical protein
MLFHRHASIVSYHIDTFLFNLPGREIPVAGRMEIRLKNLLGIDEKNPPAEFNLLSFQGDHTFEEHHLVSSQTYRHDIKPFGLGYKVTQSPAEVEPAIVIRGLHAGSPNDKGGTDVSKENISKKRNEANSNQVPKGYGGEKELSDLIIHLYIIKSEPLI